MALQWQWEYAIHIAVVIEDAIALNGENHARNKIVAWSLLRYMIVVIIFFVTLKFRLGNVLMEFVGVMGLKAAAYLQPFIHRVLYGSEGKEKPSAEQYCHITVTKEVKL